MHVARYQHTATLLQNGQVLVVGGSSTGSSGYTGSAELYTPTTGKWTTTGSLLVARYGLLTETVLQSGQVLLAGGYGVGTGALLAEAELYTPSTGKWTTTGSLNVARANHTATLLSNGQVMVAGGNDGVGPGGYSASAELYTPSTARWTTTGSLISPRQLHTATLLTNGEVLVAGGRNSTTIGPLAEAELYNSSTGVWSTTGSMNNPRAGHTATLLLNGQVIVVSGDSTQRSAELYTS
jgi:hypothetical protein